MGVIDLRPCSIELCICNGGYYDDNGDYISGSVEWTSAIKCDIVPSGKANIITLPDGTSTSYSYEVTLDRDCQEFKFGDKVRITKLNGFQEEAEVKGFHRYQLQCKIWL